MNFTEEWNCGTISGYFPRLFNRSVVFSTFEGGQLKPLTTEPVPVGDLVETPDCK